MLRTKIRASRIGASLVLVMSLAGSAAAQDKAPDKPVLESQLDAAIHSYIMRHPEVIQDALAKAALTEELDRTKRILREQSDALYRAGSPVIGAANATISIVEFFDYNCPYCRKSYPTIKQFITDNPDVRIVLKDVANLGKESEAVARLAIASRLQDKFQPFHDALMDRQGRTTEAVALEVARKLGIGIEQLKKDAVSAETSKALAITQETATRLSVDGTPLFIVGANGIPGAPDDLAAQLTKFVDAVRKSGCDVC